MSSSASSSSAGGPGTLESGSNQPSPASDRTALAWTRSALNMAASGTLIARAAFMAHLDALGVASAIALATMALLIWRHGQLIYGDRQLAGTVEHHQPRALRWLTAATVLTAGVAVVVTIAL